MNIILIGYRASGKTTYGRALAKKLGLKFLDLDELLESKINQSIKELVFLKGMDAFRKLEQEALESLSDIENTVIATGGGVILEEKNCENLKKLGKIFWLKPPIQEVIEYLKLDKTRPRLEAEKSQEQEILDTWEFRQPLYASLADETIEVSILAPVEDEVEKILKYLNYFSCK